jgi:nucleotide-binding universal stress UspA family protein
MRPRILVPFDFSAASIRALAWAADLRRTAGDPPLHLVHAISSRPAGTADVSLQMLLPNANETETLERSMVEEARSQGAAATAAVVVGASNVGDLILDAAQAWGAELIVMGSHGRTGVRRLVLGSVAEHVLRHAACPVVTVHAAHEGQRTVRPGSTSTWTGGTSS